MLFRPAKTKGARIVNQGETHSQERAASRSWWSSHCSLARLGQLSRICLALAASSVAAAECNESVAGMFNPCVPVDLEHPPELDVNAERVVFAPATGTCGDEIVQALIADFVANDVEVIDRESLALTLIEHKLALSGFLDRSTALRMGEIVGPSVMLVVKATRCDTEQEEFTRSTRRYDSEEEEYYRVPVFFSRTRVFLRLSVQTIDLASGRIFTAKTVVHSPGETFESEDDYPEHPSENRLRDIAIARTVRDIHRWFFPWTETREFVFFNTKSKHCDLKTAFQAFRDSDLDRAFELSLANVEACRNSPRRKFQSNAHYNLGLLHRVRGDFDLAVESFRQAAQLYPKRTIIAQAIGESNEAREARAAMQQIEEQAMMAFDLAREAEDEQVEDLLTNAGIVDLLKANLSEVIVIKKIETTSECEFDLSIQGLAGLAKAGVSDSVIAAMMDRASR